MPYDLYHLDAALVLNPGDADLPKLLLAIVCDRAYLVWTDAGLNWGGVVADYLQDNPAACSSALTIDEAWAIAADLGGRNAVLANYFLVGEQDTVVPLEDVGYSWISQHWPKREAEQYQYVKKACAGQEGAFMLKMPWEA